MRRPEDWFGRDDIRVSLDGRQIGRLAITDHNFLLGTSAKSIYPEGDASVHAGSRLVIEEVDLLDPNDVRLDHTFIDAEIQSGHFLGSVGGAGMTDSGSSSTRGSREPTVDNPDDVTSSAFHSGTRE